MVTSAKSFKTLTISEFQYATVNAVNTINTVTELHYTFTYCTSAIYFYILGDTQSTIGLSFC